MIAVRYLTLAVASMMLASCGSVPLSTMMHGAYFTESNFGFVDARAMSVRVSLPQGFTLDVSKTTLTAFVDSTTGSRKTELALDSRNETEGKRGASVISKEVEVTTFEMDLTEESVKALRELQGFVSQGKVKSVSFQVNVTLAQVPKGATSVKIWIELLMSPMEGYFALIDGGTLPINTTPTSGGS